MLDRTDALCVLERGDMAKKKAAVVGAGKVKPKQVILLVYKADPERGEEYKAWLEGLAEHTAAPLTVMMDQALQNWAKVNNYVPPPRRLR